jgi:hypothetical protein
MTRTHRIIAVALIGFLVLTGFAIGRFTTVSQTKAAEESKPVGNDVQPQPVADVAGNDQFYLSDFKTGYNEGYQAALNEHSPATVDSTRQGFNEGYKQGYADSYQAQLKAQEENTEPVAKVSTAPAVAQASRERVVYRTVSQPVYRTAQPVYHAPVRRGRSKLQTALTIGAPAALAAGIGAMIGGKKGAGIGALLGGGGGAIYELRKHRNRD